ncbi:MAG: hemerythrin domain-containing protein [Alphaproteobacteria bacterium]|nr:hemerythrin domain-containing protein [Alphaproteobacteria bacterium]
MDANRWLAFAGGVSLGVIADRVLPPLVSQAMPLGDPFEALVADHRHFLNLLDQMAQSRGRGVVWRTQILLRLKRGLTAHALAEEDVIYPMLDEQAHAERAAGALYSDHGLIKTHLYALERGLAEESPWLARVGTLRNLLERHARQEEDIEFPRLRALMDQDGMTRLGRHIRREKAMVL